MGKKLIESDFLGMFEPGTQYSEQLITVTVDGLIVGLGHQTPAMFLPAALHIYRAELEGEEEPNAVEMQHLWGVPAKYESPSCWGITTDNIQADTPNAVAVTVLDV